MLHRLLCWLVSLRVQLIATYALVAAISFLVLNLMLTQPVERFLIQREEDALESTAHTIGTTIRTPWNVDDTTWQADQFWTQRRSSDVSAVIKARIRMLDANGRILTDSAWGHPTALQQWKDDKATAPSLSMNDDIRQAMQGQYSSSRNSEFATLDDPNARSITHLNVAKPIMRTVMHNGESKPQLAFIIYLDKPIDSVRHDLRELRSLLLRIMLGSMLIAVLAGILLSSKLSAGLHAATRIAQEFALGRMNLRMRGSGLDEVGQLGHAFNQMADALQRQEQLRRDLLADVSHELRTPLTAIAGCADTLADGTLQDDPDAAEHFLSIILRESARLQRLVSDILELSRLQAGAVMIPRTPISLKTLVADAVEIARLHARQEGITVQCNCADDVPDELVTVLGNEDRLAQALRNLLDNARHHTPVDRAITVSLTYTDTEVCVSIRDEGEGIPPDDLPWVFDRFYRSGKGGAKAGGTGLGLAIVREIVQAHEGHITFDSTLGVGTTFSLHFPRVQAEQVINV